MDSGFIHEYFEKATALVLASAGIESVEKQALHLLAGEAERYARALGANAARLAEAARRSECTVADIEAAAALLSDANDNDKSNSIHVSSEMKKKLRLSVEISSAIDTPVSADIRLPQLAPDSVESLMPIDEAVLSPSKGAVRRNSAYPDWLQKEIEKKQQELNTKEAGEAISGIKEGAAKTAQPSLVSSLVLAEEEAREILTNKLQIESNKIPSNRPLGSHS